MNKNQIGLNNKTKRYGLYLIENDEAKCLSRSENYKTLIKEMRRLANENYQFNFRSDDNRTYEVRDDSWSFVYVVDYCNFCEKY